MKYTLKQTEKAQNMALDLHEIPHRSVICFRVQSISGMLITTEIEQTTTIHPGAYVVHLLQQRKRKKNHFYRMITLPEMYKSASLA